MLRLGRATLRHVDLGSCHSSALTAKTLLSLSRVPGLETLHVMWEHFKWMDLSLRFLGADFRPRQSIRTLSIKFGFDNYKNSTFFDPNVHHQLWKFSSQGKLTIIIE